MDYKTYQHSMDFVTRGGRTPEECEQRAFEHGHAAYRLGKHRVPPFTTAALASPLIGAWLRGYDAASQSEDEFWICYPNMSKAGLYRVLYAVIMVRGAITQTFTLADKRWAPEQHARCTADLMVRIPKGTRERFAELAQCEMEAPPKVRVNAQPAGAGRGDTDASPADAVSSLT